MRPVIVVYGQVDFVPETVRFGDIAANSYRHNMVFYSTARKSASFYDSATEYVKLATIAGRQLHSLDHSVTPWKIAFSLHHCHTTCCYQEMLNKTNVHNLSRSRRVITTHKHVWILTMQCMTECIIDLMPYAIILHSTYEQNNTFSRFVNFARTCTNLSAPNVIIWVSQLLAYVLRNKSQRMNSSSVVDPVNTWALRKATQLVFPVASIDQRNRASRNPAAALLFTKTIRNAVRCVAISFVRFYETNSPCRNSIAESTILQHISML